MSSFISWTDDDAVLLKYSPGDTIPGESFSRSTTALQKDSAGVYQSAAINAKRDAHYIGGVRSTLLEDTRINSTVQSWDLTAAAWTGAASRALNAVGLLGTSNTATTLTDNSAVAIQNRSPTTPIVVANDGAKHTAAFWIKKDTDQTRFPALYAYLNGGTIVDRQVQLNTQTGAVTSLLATGTSTFRVIDDGLWWIVEIVLTNNASGNVNFAGEISPASGTVFGTSAAAAQGSCIVGNVQMEKNSAFVSSAILTTTVAVTRGADSYSMPAPPPGETTVYEKFVEGGTINTALARRWNISNVGAADPSFFVYAPAGLYRVIHNNGFTPTIATLGVAPVIGDTGELLTHLFGSGGDDISQSINGATATSAADLAPNPLAGAWSGPLVWLNSAGTVAVGFTALQSFKIVAGARSLTEMRAIASPISFSNGRPTPLDRLANWTPMSKPIGPAETALGTGRRYVFPFRTDHTVSFEIRNIPNTLLWQALKLQDHLLRGGLVSVTTGDSLNSVYTQCCLAPGSEPQITMSDARELEYTLSVTLLNVAGSPFRMLAQY